MRKCSIIEVIIIRRCSHVCLPYLCRKKPEFAVEANSLIGGIKSALGLENLTGLRVINRYDAEGLSREDFDLAAPVVFSEPAVDVTYDHLPAVKADEFVFAVEYLPGQFDQRADSCAQCISLLTGGKDLLSSQREFISFLANSQKQSLTRSSTI